MGRDNQSALGTADDFCSRPALRLRVVVSARRYSAVRLLALAGVCAEDW
jgi:hypothetical protein